MPDRCRFRQGSGSGGFLHHFLLWRLRFGQASDKDVGRRPALHVAALSEHTSIVGGEELLQGRLHLVDGLELGSPAFDSEVIVEQDFLLRLPERGGLPAMDGHVVTVVVGSGAIVDGDALICVQLHASKQPKKLRFVEQNPRRFEEGHRQFGRCQGRDCGFSCVFLEVAPVPEATSAALQ